jgi:gliding motility-associated-like protein
LTIFNRWGELVFETYDASKGWNGTYGDKGIVADGAYIWKLEFGDPTNDKRFYEEGLVIIIR